VLLNVGATVFALLLFPAIVDLLDIIVRGLTVDIGVAEFVDFFEPLAPFGGEGAIDCRSIGFKFRDEVQKTGVFLFKVRQVGCQFLRGVGHVGIWGNTQELFNGVQFLANAFPLKFLGVLRSITALARPPV
jgi:hypothetical protein